MDPDDGDRVVVYPPGPLQWGSPGPEGALQEPDGHVLVVDRSARAVVQVPPLRRNARHPREVTVVSGRGRGSGPQLQQPQRLGQLSDGRLVLLDQGLRAVVTVDRKSGNRTVLRGDGPRLDEPDDLVVQDDRVFVSDNFTGWVVEVDPSTGDRRLADDVRKPPAPTITRPFGLGPGAAGELLVADPIIGTVLSLPSRKVVSSPRTGSGVLAPQVFDAIRLQDGTAVLSDPRGRRLVRVAAQGTRTVLSGPSGPTGLLEAVDNCVWAGRRVLVADALGGRVLEVDPSTGRFTEVSGPARGSGPEIRCPNEIAEGPDAIWLVDWVAGLVRIDPATGDRTVVASSRKQMFDVTVAANGQVYLLDTRVPGVFRRDGTRVPGPPFEYPGRLVASGDRLLVTDMDARTVVELDPRTGSHRLLAGPGVGSGIELAMPEALVVLPSGEVLVSDVNRGTIVAIAPDGARRLVSGPDRGAGPPLDAPEDMAWWGDGQVLVSDPGYGGLIVLDPATGDRRLVPLRAR